MILKFEEFINEAKRNLTFDYFKDLVVKKLGWNYAVNGPDHKFFTTVTDKDGVKRPLTVMIHIKHSKNIIDPKSFQELKDELVRGFQYTGSLGQIEKVNWNEIGIPDPRTQKTSVVYQALNPDEPEENIGHRLQKARMEKDRQRANDRYRNARMTKIDINDKNSGYVMMWVNEQGKRMYNTCKSEDDRRPLLKFWTSELNYEMKNGRHYFGKDDMRMMKTKFYEVLPDGSLDQTVKFFKENKNIDKNLEML